MGLMIVLCQAKKQNNCLNVSKILKNIERGNIAGLHITVKFHKGKV